MEGAINSQSITVHVKFGARTLPLSLPPEATVHDIKSQLQPLTNVLTRGQKLIFKGKVLVDTMTLKSLSMSDGSKVLLLASQGLHQGDGPITKDAAAPSNSRSVDVSQSGHAKIEPQMVKSRSERWKVTGIVALAECHLKVVPEEVWACKASVRVLDISNNLIEVVPIEIGSLSSMQKLLLNSNAILDDKLSWVGLTSLKFLTFLSLCHNLLTTLPSAIGDLTSLRQLHVAHNKLISLPAEIGLLSQLQILKANNNRISAVPSNIGSCHSLNEVNFSSNLLVELPHTIGNLHNLKVLRLSNNGLKSLPPTLFRMCSRLSTLDLHGTEFTIDKLRQPVHPTSLEPFDHQDQRSTMHIGMLNKTKQLLPVFALLGTPDSIWSLHRVQPRAQPPQNNRVVQPGSTNSLPSFSVR